MRGIHRRRGDQQGYKYFAGPPPKSIHRLDGSNAVRGLINRYQARYGKEREIGHIDQYIERNDDDNPDTDANGYISFWVFYFAPDITDASPTLVSPEGGKHRRKYRGKCDRLAVIGRHDENPVQMRLAA